jgi:ribose transport system substrate-binding protein
VREEIPYVPNQETSMKTMRQIAVIMMALGIASISGCNNEPKKDVFYMIATNVTLPYWQTVANGFNKAAAQYKVVAKIVGPQSYDPLGELDALEQAVRAKPAGILISVSDVSTLERQIDLAVQEGIPVITIDSDAVVSHRLYFIGTNNLEAGRLGGIRLVEKLGNKGNVVFFTIPGQPNTEERLRGFKEALKTQPGIKIADIVDIKGDASIAFDKAQRLLALTGSQKVDAFVCLEAVSGKPVSDAIKRASIHDREVIAWDADPGTLDAIQDGTIDATIAQKPYTMGYFGLKLLYEAFHSPPTRLDKDFRSDFYSPYPVFIDTGTTLVDRSNVGLYLSVAAANK